MAPDGFSQFHPSKAVIELAERVTQDDMIATGAAPLGRATRGDEKQRNLAGNLWQTCAFTPTERVSAARVLGEIVTIPKSASSSPKVLIVEDEPLIGMMLEEMLLDAGCEIAGNAHSLRGALALAETAEFDLAILDLSLGTESSLPVADVLARRDRPFMFASGYGSASLPIEHRDRIVLDKPFHFPALLKKLELALPGWIPAPNP